MRRGAVELGELPGIARISATLGGTQQTWPMPLGGDGEPSRRATA